MARPDPFPAVAGLAVLSLALGYLSLVAGSGAAGRLALVAAGLLAGVWPVTLLRREMR